MKFPRVLLSLSWVLVTLLLVLSSSEGSDTPDDTKIEMTVGTLGLNDNCESRNIEEHFPLLCAVLYHEENCEEHFGNGHILMHEAFYDTNDSKPVLSLYLHGGCTIQRSRSGVGEFEYYERGITSSRNKIPEISFPVTDIYDCECYNIIDGLSSYVPVTNTTQVTTKSAPTKLTSTISTRDTSELSTDVSQAPTNNIDASVEPANFLIIGAAVLASLGVCIIYIACGVLYFRGKGWNGDSESITKTFEGIRNYETVHTNGSLMQEQAVSKPTQEIHRDNFNSNSDSTEEIVEGQVVPNVLPNSTETSKDEDKDTFPANEALPYDLKFEINRDQFQFDAEDATAKIGYGAFGLVYKGTLLTLDKKQFREIAIKTVQGVSNISGKEFLKSLLNEIKVLSHVGYHQNIVYFIGACTVNLQKGEVFLIMDYCANGNLLSYLQNIPLDLKTLPKSRRKTAIPKSGTTGYLADDGTHDDIFIEVLSLHNYKLMLQWSLQIADGMEYLSSRDVLHIDLAARNILLTKDLTAKISDFGLSRKIYTDVNYKKNQQSVLIPIPWLALETITEKRMDKRYSKKSDVWAYGVTIWEVFSKGKNPYDGLDFQEIFCMLNRGERLSRPPFAPNDVLELSEYHKMLECWAHDPYKRPSFTNLRDFFLTTLTNDQTDVIFK